MPEERRRYFRIDDTIGLSYRVLGTQEAKVFAEQTRNQGSNFDFAANFDNRIQTLLDACRIQSPLAAELIDLMNKKLNFVVRQMDVDTELMHKVAYTLRQVNVSACGSIRKDSRRRSALIPLPKRNSPFTTCNTRARRWAAER